MDKQSEWPINERLFELAKKLNFARLPLRPGLVIGEGEEGWRKFCAWPNLAEHGDAIVLVKLAIQKARKDASGS